MLTNKHKYANILVQIIIITLSGYIICQWYLDKICGVLFFWPISDLHLFECWWTVHELLAKVSWWKLLQCLYNYIVQIFIKNEDQESLFELHCLLEAQWQYHNCYVIMEKHIISWLWLQYTNIQRYMSCWTI